jgi:hypothetical protein
MKTQKTYPIVRDSPHSRRMTVEFFPWMVEERRGKNAAAYYLTRGGASRKPDEGERAVHFKNLHRCVPVTHDKETGRSGETSVTEPVVNEIEPTEG